MRPLPPNVRARSRLEFALFLVAWPLAACTSILGIDGNYVTGAGSGADGGANANAGGDGKGGGPGNSAGGAGGTLNHAGSGGDPGGGGAGGQKPPPPTGGTAGTLPPPVEAGSPDCLPGTYGGSFAGRHAPALTVVGVPFNVSGNFTFTLSGTGRVLHVTQTNVFHSQLAWGEWQLDLTGDFDCDQQMFTGTLSGQITAAPAFAKLDGTITGPLSVAGGVWQEQETASPNPTNSCKPSSGFTPTGTGCGTWKVTSGP